MIIKNRLTVFVVSAFAFSWISSLPLYFTKTVVNSPSYFLILFFFMAGPMTAAVIVKRFARHYSSFNNKFGSIYLYNCKKQGGT